MSSSLIPFLIFTAMSQQNIINQQRTQMNSYRSSSRSRSSSNSYRSSPRLPEKMSYILEKAGSRERGGVSYFDLLLIRAIHSDEKTQQVILNLENNYKNIVKKNKEKVVSQIGDIAAKTENAYTKAESQLKNLKAMGFDVKYPTREYSMFYKENNYNIKGVLPSSENKDGYKTKYFEFPKYLNGLDITSEAFKLANPFEMPLNEYLSKHPDHENKLTEAKERVERLNKNKLALIFSKKRRAELAAAQTNHQELLSVSEKITKHKEAVTFFDNLSLGQKNEFRDFIRNINTIKTLSSDAKKYIEANYLVDKYSSMECTTEKINAYHSALVKQAATLLSKDDILTLAEFEERASNKILSLSDAQAKEIIKNSSGLTSSFEIDGNVIDNSILYELSDSCRERISEITAEKQDTQANETTLER